MGTLLWKAIAAGAVLLVAVDVLSDWWSLWRLDRQKLKLPRPRKPGVQI